MKKDMLSSAEAHRFEQALSLQGPLSYNITEEKKNLIWQATNALLYSLNEDSSTFDEKNEEILKEAFSPIFHCFSDDEKNETLGILADLTTLSFLNEKKIYINIPKDMCIYP